MKPFSTQVGLLLLCAFSIYTAAPAAAWGNDVYVPGHVRSNGTYVDSYYRTKADGYSFNNYSYSGNINPYTGSLGTHGPGFGSSLTQPKSSYSSGFDYRPTHSYSNDSGYKSSSSFGTIPNYTHAASSSIFGSNHSYGSSSSSSWLSSGFGSTANSLFSATRNAFDRLPFRW